MKTPFKKDKNLLRDGILNLAISLSQSPVTTFQRESERGLTVKELNFKRF